MAAKCANACLFVLSTQNRSEVAGVRCHREGNLRHYYFHKAGLLRSQNQPVDQVTGAALLKYAQKCT